MANNGVLPFANPVMLDELWKNLLYDLGLVIPGNSGGPIEMRGILKSLDQGLSGLGLGTYGTGSDGKVTFDGTSTVLGLAPSTGVYTLTRDIYLADQSTIAAAATIETAGFRIFCAGHLYINGTIDSSGNAAAANVAGALLAYTGTISNTTVGSAGHAGGTGAGTAGTAAATNALGGAGGAGGNNASVPNLGGAGGAVTAPAATVQNLNSLQNALAVRVIGTTALALCLGGAGGGSGGGDGTNNSGGGGGGGGIVALYAQTISGSGTVSAKGGAGGAANATGTPSGGGGGGGGAIIFVSRSVSATPTFGVPGVTTISGVTFTVAGGAAGAAGAGGGTPGVAGSAGNLIALSA